MRKIDEVLERLEKIEDYLREGRYSDKLRLDQSDANILCQANTIRDLTAKNAVLERENELLAAALILKGDTEIIVYNGKRYKVCKKTLTGSENEWDSLVVDCVLIEE